jgi:hypothetical protein
MAQFSSTFYTTRDLAKFDPNNYFSHYHYFEKYDENKKYNYDSFLEKYGDRDEHNYLYKLCIINDLHNLEKKEKYVIAEENINDKELSELQYYCQCLYHVTPHPIWYNPLTWGNCIKYTYCTVCNGCIRNPSFTNQYVIDKTREAKKNNKHIEDNDTNMLMIITFVFILIICLLRSANNNI